MTTIRLESKLEGVALLINLTADDLDILVSDGQIRLDDLTIDPDSVALPDPEQICRVVLTVNDDTPTDPAT
jgi:hypothetical protein